MGGARLAPPYLAQHELAVLVDDQVPELVDLEQLRERRQNVALPASHVSETSANRQRVVVWFGASALS
jgi:hypothetical protein